MVYIVDFKEVVIIGLESLLVVFVFVGLRVNEVCYFWNKYKYCFMIVFVFEVLEILVWIEKILLEWELYFFYKLFEIFFFILDGIKMVYVFYENGLVVNVMYILVEEGKCVVGFKFLDGMVIFVEFEGKFKFVC